MNFHDPIIINAVIDIVSSLCVAFILFAFGFILFMKPHIKISSKIARSENYQNELPQYEFKIVNKSFFIEARDFEIHLYPIEKKINKYDNTFTTNYNVEDEFKLRHRFLLNLGTYKPKALLFLIRKFNKEYTTHFNCFLTTLEDITKHQTRYSELRLVILYTDSLNKKQFIMQDFDLKKTIIFDGDFPNDGSLNKISPMPVKV